MSAASHRGTKQHDSTYIPLVNRKRAIYIVLALVTIAAGLPLHLRATTLGPVVRDVTGDALWAAMMTLWPALWRPPRGQRGRCSM